MTPVDMMRVRKQAYLYLFNEIDQLIHRPLSLEKRHAQIESALTVLASDIAEAYEEFNKIHGEVLGIVITSDHGFTEVLRDIPPLKLDSKYSGSISHSRVLHLDSDEELLEDDFVKTGPSMLGGAKANFYVPRGYVCLDSKPRGATHGGLTPQEVVIPVMQYKFVEEIIFKDIEIAFIGEVRRGRAENYIILTLMNPNDVHVIINEIKIRLINTQSKLPCRIDPNSSVELNCLVDGTHLRQKRISMNGTLSLVLLGESMSMEVDFFIETTGAALVDQAFEEDFDA
jgi:hypothetical protein